mmetsp:Transcript_36882/g.114815  ORF Transcript_36882/g.114815 Transcript_36882/m.114815 type:complete len:247 (+) Transcript_36882:232-972(+)
MPPALDPKDEHVAVEALHEALPLAGLPRQVLVDVHVGHALGVVVSHRLRGRHLRPEPRRPLPDNREARQVGEVEEQGVQHGPMAVAQAEEADLEGGDPAEAMPGEELPESPEDAVLRPAAEGLRPAVVQLQEVGDPRDLGAAREVQHKQPAVVVGRRHDVVVQRGRGKDGRAILHAQQVGAVGHSEAVLLRPVQARQAGRVVVQLRQELAGPAAVPEEHHTCVDELLPVHGGVVRPDVLGPHMGIW